MGQRAAIKSVVVLAVRTYKFGNAVDGSVFYVSMKPCEDCLKMIANLNVKHIYYSKEYDMFKQYSEPVQQMIKDLDIEIRRIE